MSYESLYPLLKSSKSKMNVEQFHEKINVIFHDHEAAFYDALHTDMWESLQEQINLLVDDVTAVATIGNNASLLDIGCGTGLSTQLLLQSKLGEAIQNITLLDTSPKMLEMALQKATLWNKKVKTINNSLSQVQEKFDVIIISSVLHHIPDLETFLKQVDDALNPGGILLHLQDPNGDFLNDDEYLNRKMSFEASVNNAPRAKKVADFIPKNWKRNINRLLGRKDYIDLINDELLRQNVIGRRITADEIWSVTDIHVESKSNTVNKGISLQFLKKQLKHFNLVKMRSYGFFGVLKGDLTEEYKKVESELIALNKSNGRNIAAVWLKNT